MAFRRFDTFRLADTTLKCPCHACAFFTEKEEEYAILIPFMQEGIARGERCINIIDKGHRAERLSRLQRVGIDVTAAETRGQLDLQTWEVAHAVEGHFDQNRMLAQLERQAGEGTSRYPMTRMWSNQEWALQGLPGVQDVIEYEARFNYVWPKLFDVFICVYDARKFSAALMTQMMRTHPYVVIDGMLRENPFYVPPDEFLKEARDRRIPLGPETGAI
jgi:hypothetical protein